MKVTATYYDARNIVVGTNELDLLDGPIWGMLYNPAHTAITVVHNGGKITYTRSPSS